MVFVPCHSQLFCVGGMEHSDSESNFKLYEVDPVVDGFSEDFSETSSEEQQERDSGQEADTDDVDSGNDTDGGVEIVLWIRFCCVSFCRAERSTDFGKTPISLGAYKY